MDIPEDFVLEFSSCKPDKMYGDMVELVECKFLHRIPSYRWHIEETPLSLLPRVTWSVLE
jgi:hypothetical protein